MDCFYFTEKIVKTEHEEKIPLFVHELWGLRAKQRTTLSSGFSRLIFGCTQPVLIAYKKTICTSGLRQGLSIDIFIQIKISNNSKTHNPKIKHHNAWTF